MSLISGGRTWPGSFRKFNLFYAVKDQWNSFSKESSSIYVPLYDSAKCLPLLLLLLLWMNELCIWNFILRSWNWVSPCQYNYVASLWRQSSKQMIHTPVRKGRNIIRKKWCTFRANIYLHVTPQTNGTCSVKKLLGFRPHLRTVRVIHLLCERRRVVVSDVDRYVFTRSYQMPFSSSFRYL